MLSDKAKNIKASPTLALVAQAKELQAKGFDVISLTVGEPDWPTYEIPRKAGIQAIEQGFTKYTAASGIIELRQALAKKFTNETGVEYQANQVTVGPGAKFVIFSALQMICNPGDEVILNSPYWVSYPTMIELADGKPVIVDCDAKSDFKITPDQLRRAITPKTKGFLFCSPSNPTGLMYSKSELKELAKVFLENPQIVILSDDMYNRLVFDGSKVAPHILHVEPSLADRTVVINGGSKAYSMTGWRIGWAAGPKNLIQAMGDYQSQTTGCPSSIAQKAALAAVQNCEPQVTESVELLKRRRTLCLDLLKEIPLLKVNPPDGAIYLWVDVSAARGKKFQGREIKDDRDISDILLNKFWVATVPGFESGTPGYMRLSFAVEEKRFAEAAQRMKKFFAELV